MNLADRAKRAGARAAAIAVATSGLSACGDGSGGVVDPAPPPLECNNSTEAGGPLTATATRSADTLSVTIRHAASGATTWRVTRISEVSGATIYSSTLPLQGFQPAVIDFKLATPTTTTVVFTLEGIFIGFANEGCLFKRRFTVTINAGGISIAQAEADALPLAARNRAEIVLVDRTDRTARLDLRTRFQGTFDVGWTVTAGTLEAAERGVLWTLPAAPGIYQAEAAVDFGADGVAFDALMLEVTTPDD